MDDDRPRHLATGENFDWELETPGYALREKHLGRYRTLDLNGLEAAEIDHFPRRFVDICEAALVRHSLLDRQLAALESAPYPRSAAGLLTLGSPAGGLAFAAPMAAADTPAFSVRTYSAAQIVKCEAWFCSLSTSRVYA